MKKIKSDREDFRLVALGDKVLLFVFSHWGFFHPAQKVMAPSEKQTAKMKTKPGIAPNRRLHESRTVEIVWKSWYAFLKVTVKVFVAISVKLTYSPE